MSLCFVEVPQPFLHGLISVFRFYDIVATLLMRHFVEAVVG